MADNTSAAGIRPKPSKNDMPRIHWRSAALAGIAAGVVATLAQIALWWLSSEPLPAILLRDARLTAAIIMGREVLPPPATFDWSVTLIATLVHFALSIAYGLALSVFHIASRYAAFSARRRGIRSVLVRDQYVWLYVRLSVVCRGPRLDHRRHARHLRHGRVGCIQDVANAGFSFD